MRDQAARYAAQPYPHPADDPRCQGCSMITDRMIECLGLCDGMRGEADLRARGALWQAIPKTFGPVGATS